MVGVDDGDVAAALVDLVTTPERGSGLTPGDARPLRAVVLFRGALPVAIEQAYRSASQEPPLVVLARALAASRGWAPERPALLVARPEPTPALVAIGPFDAADQARLEALRDQLRVVLPRTRFIDYAAVETACARLAEHLSDRIGAEALGSMRFTAVPRGGLIVLGLLGYTLGLSHSQLGAHDHEAPGDGPLVVVDDRIISGVRMRQFLARRPERHLVVACLHAHPAARVALRERDARIREVVSAHDFHDYARRDLGATYDAWRERWRQRSHRDSVWVGRPEHVCYPWSEPDVGVWNPVTAREEPGWSVMPPELCLARRRAPARTPLQPQVQAPTEGRVRPSQDVVYGIWNDDVVIVDLASSTCYGLTGTAAIAWRALVAAGDEVAAAEAISAAYDVEPWTALADVRALVAEVRAAGLLEGPET